MTEETNWYDKYSFMEGQFMQMLDKYADLARALGFPGDGFYGDPLAPHAEIIARVVELASFARVA